MIKLRAHHVETIACVVSDNFLEFNDRFTKYGEPFKGYLKALRDSIMNDPFLQVVIVRGPDDICQSNEALCPLRDESCERKDCPADARCEEEYGLVFSQIYVGADIIRVIKEFTDRTGYIGPRERLRGDFKKLAEVMKRRTE